MKPAETRQRYIELRAEGKSYSYIAKTLHISKSTCTKWERELASEIKDFKRAELVTLYESYGMSKEARIKKLGATLDKINEALDSIDFSEINPAKLLEYKLKYTEALKGEAVGLRKVIDPQHLDTEEIAEALADLLSRTQAGEITAEQTQRELLIISNLLKVEEKIWA